MLSQYAAAQVDVFEIIFTPKHVQYNEQCFLSFFLDLKQFRIELCTTCYYPSRVSKNNEITLAQKG